MSDHSQMLKGILEGCILAVVAEGETYGYELGKRLEESGLGAVGEGSLYPALLRMERDGLVEGEMKESEKGPKRKYYKLTEKGARGLEAFASRWRGMKRSVDSVLGKRGEEE